MVIACVVSSSRRACLKGNQQHTASKRSLPQGAALTPSSSSPILKPCILLGAYRLYIKSTRKTPAISFDQTSPIHSIGMVFRSLRLLAKNGHLRRPLKEMNETSLAPVQEAHSSQEKQKFRFWTASMRKVTMNAEHSFRKASLKRNA